MRLPAALRLRLIVIAAASVGILLTGALTVLQLQGSLTAGCSGCDLVLSSPVSHLFGLPLSVYGLVFYAFILLLALRSTTAIGWIVLTAEAGLVLSLGLTAYAGLVLHAACAWCLTSLALVMIILAAALRQRRIAGDPVPAGRVPASGVFRRNVATCVGILLCGILLFRGGAIYEAWGKERSGSARADSTAASSSDEPVRTGPPPPLDLALGRTLGRAEAPLRIVEFFNPRCVHCRTYRKETYPRIVASLVTSGRARYEVRFLAPPSLPEAVAAACAGMQGRFFEYLETMPSDAPASADDLRAAAQSAGVRDLAAFAACIEDPAVRGRIAADALMARHHGVRVTPSVWIGDRLIEGRRLTNEYLAAAQPAIPG